MSQENATERNIANCVKSGLLPRVSSMAEKAYLAALIDVLASRNYNLQRRGLDTMEVREFLDEKAIQEIIQMAWPSPIGVTINGQFYENSGVSEELLEAFRNAMRGLGYQGGKPMSANAIYIAHVAHIEEALKTQVSA